MMVQFQSKGRKTLMSLLEIRLEELSLIPGGPAFLFRASADLIRLNHFGEGHLYFTSHNFRSDV